MLQTSKSAENEGVASVFEGEVSQKKMVGFAMPCQCQQKERAEQVLVFLKEARQPRIRGHYKGICLPVMKIDGRAPSLRLVAVRWHWNIKRIYACTLGPGGGTALGG
eukprot:738722-Pelagomonas_calceolata.AAC.1